VAILQKGRIQVRIQAIGFGAACLLVVASMTQADQLPHRKPGAWQMTRSSPDSKMPPMTATLCVDAASESALVDMGKSSAKKMCSKSEVHFNGDNGTIDTVCKFGNLTQTSHSTIRFTGPDAFRVETHSHFDPPLAGMADRTTIAESKWLGPCPANMKPGDVVMANGMKMNIDPRGEK
jgi:Protein of unknown function (DUF3617)